MVPSNQTGVTGAARWLVVEEPRPAEGCRFTYPLEVRPAGIVPGPDFSSLCSPPLEVYLTSQLPERATAAPHCVDVVLSCAAKAFVVSYQGGGSGLAGRESEALSPWRLLAV